MALSRKRLQQLFVQTDPLALQMPKEAGSAMEASNSTNSSVARPGHPAFGLNDLNVMRKTVPKRLPFHLFSHVFTPVPSNSVGFRLLFHRHPSQESMQEVFCYVVRSLVSRSGPIQPGPMRNQTLQVFGCAFWSLFSALDRSAPWPKTLTASDVA